jgi:predicted PurR-regulated permease PerM
VLTEALIALFLAISLDPAVRMLMRWHIQRGVAILVVVLVALGLTAAFLQSVIPALVDQFQAMARDFPHYMANLQHRSASFRQITDRFHLTAQANTLLARLPGELGGGAVGFTRRTFSTLASAVLVAVLTIYFLADLPRLQRGAVLLFPRAHRDRFARIADVLVDKVGSYMIGNIAISLIAGAARGYYYQLLSGIGWTSLPRLHTLRPPTLILAGDDDAIIPLVNARIMHRLIPDSQLHVYHGGHLELGIGAERLAPVVEAFLDAYPTAEGNRQ